VAFTEAMRIRTSVGEQVLTRHPLRLEAPARLGSWADRSLAKAKQSRSRSRGVTLVAIVGAFRATADTHTAGRRDLG
jgi:hypothetical protein